MFNQEITHIKNSSKKRLSETCYRDIALIDPNLIHDSVNTYAARLRDTVNICLSCKHLYTGVNTAAIMYWEPAKICFNCVMQAKLASNHQLIFWFSETNFAENWPKGPPRPHYLSSLIFALFDKQDKGSATIYDQLGATRLQLESQWLILSC